MTMPGDYSEELVELVRSVGSRSCGLSLHPDTAHKILDALSSSGRLVPEGSEVREEWGVIVHGRYGDLWDGCGDRKSAEREVESKRVRTFPREVGTRKVIWTPPVAWTPTEPEEKS